MTSINEQMGYKRPGKRRMMKGTGKDTAAAALTSSPCPNCPHRWIIENKIHGVLRRMCAWCSNTEGLGPAYRAPAPPAEAPIGRALTVDEFMEAFE